MKSLVLLVEGPFRTGHCWLNCYSHDVVTQTRLHINYVPRYYRNCKPFRRERERKKINNPLPYKSKPQPNQDSDANFLNETARHGRRLPPTPPQFLSSHLIQQLSYDDDDYDDDDHHHHEEEEDRFRYTAFYAATRGRKFEAHRQGWSYFRFCIKTVCT